MNDVARTANWEGRSDKRRLLLKVSDELKRTIVDAAYDEVDLYMVAINLEDGSVSAYWVSKNEVTEFSDQYTNVRRMD